MRVTPKTKFPSNKGLGRYVLPLKQNFLLDQDYIFCKYMKMPSQKNKNTRVSPNSFELTWVLVI